MDEDALAGVFFVESVGEHARLHCRSCQFDRGSGETGFCTEAWCQRVITTGAEIFDPWPRLSAWSVRSAEDGLIRYRDGTHITVESEGARWERRKGRSRLRGSWDRAPGKIGWQGCDLQGNANTIEGGEQHTGEHLKAAGDPVISVDTKKKELVGPYKNGGAEWAPGRGARTGQGPRLH